MKLNQFLITITVFIFLGSRMFSAQVGINTAVPDNNSVLDIVSTAKGVLIPRLDQTQTDALATLVPADGMLVYNVESRCIQIYRRSSATEGAFSCLSTGTHDLRLVGINNHITQDAGVGNNGTSTGTGVDNIGIGRNTLVRQIDGNSNIALGSFALFSNTTGNNNIAIGVNALAGNSTGSGNILVGYNSGSGISTGSNNTIIGNSIAITENDLSNNIILADGAGVQRIRVISDGKTGINKTAPLSTLDVNGSIGANYIYTTSAITLNDTHHFVNASGSNYQITLPDPALSKNRAYKIRTEGTNITISTYKNLNGINSTTLATNSSIILVSSGLQWIEF